VRRLLAIRLDNIGDVIMLAPALRALRHALPAARLTLLASPAGSRAAPLLPWIDDVIAWTSVWQDAGGTMPIDPAREATFVDALRTRRFDAAIVFTSFAQSPYPPAYVCWLAGVPIRVGQSKEFGGSLLSQWVHPPPDGGHQVERNLFLLETAGFSIPDRRPVIHVPPAARAGATRLLASVGVRADAPFVLLAPGATCAARRYAPERFGGVARGLARDAGLPVVAVGSPRDADVAAAVLESADDPRVVSLVGRDTIPELAALVERAALVVANNSAPMHLADALRRPMVILFSGTEDEGQFRPRSAAARLLRRPTPCTPCRAFRCSFGMECLDIPPDEVVAEAVALLAARGVGQRAVATSATCATAATARVADTSGSR
jgi:ADP-heptose:LPS heptosyltransferase